MATRSAKEVELLGNGAGWSAEFWLKVTRAVAAAGGTVEDVSRVATKPEGEDVIRQIAGLIVPTTAIESVSDSEIIPFTVNYRQSQRAAIAAGNFSSKNDYYDELKWKDWTAPDGTEDHFPSSGKVEMEAIIVAPGRWISSPEAEAEIVRRGLTPATSPESIAYAKAHQGRFGEPIVGLGSVVVDPYGDRGVVMLWSRGGLGPRYLGLPWYDERQWDPHCRFLGVRKKQSSDA
ncbi:MAG: hypothetical protein WD926_02105 [Patescibacteria group bacterium]